jgi:hypothetical protein
MSWYWNRLWSLRHEKPSKTKATEVSRILAVLSFSKFLLIDGKRSRKRAQDKYEKAVKSFTGQLKNEMAMTDDDPEYLEMVEFVNSLNINRQGEDMAFDRRCYSLKCLVGKRVHRPPVPPAYGMSHSVSAIASFGSDNGDYFNRPNRLVNVINRSYYSSEKYDGKLQVIAESGGKYRGICPYESPYAHSVNLYKKARDVLMRLPGNCNYDQSRGHLIAQELSSNDRTVVSADASDFSDTMQPARLAYMAKALGSSGAVHYHGMLRIKTFDGSIVKSDVPLMGWKGTFDLASVMLAFSFWKYKYLFPSGIKAQCGDDYVGVGSLEAYQRAYEYVGCKLSKGKTVVSKTVSVFCGEMFWLGYKITPIRILMATFGDSHKYIGKLINRVRSFIPNCNYAKHAKRTIFRKLKKILGDRYNGYLDFRLSSDLGGIPLDLGQPVALEHYLKTNKSALFCALRNIPVEKEEFNSYHTAFSHLPLGKPYDIYGMGSTLSAGSWPKVVRVQQAERKQRLRELLSSDKVSYLDVLLYTYDNSMLLRP